MVRLIFISMFFSVFAHSSLFPQNSKDHLTTLFEKSGYLRTSGYEETINFFTIIAGKSPFAEIQSFGFSPEGRELFAVILSNDKHFEPVQREKRKKPLVIILNGIHSGEIEGKEASMLLVREILITGEKQEYLDYADLLIVPVFNIDGHERFSPYNRINQVGPEQMGWRSTSHNLNLNRDWMKADSPEMTAFLTLFNKWDPDFIIDSHTTNGADYQYTATYAIEKDRNIYQGLAGWISSRFLPFMESHMESKNYLTFPYVSFKNWQEGVESGIMEGTFSPRFSNGYSAARNVPGLLIETHMLKTFKQRVFSTKEMIESILLLLKEDKQLLLNLRAEAETEWSRKYGVHKEWFPINFKITDDYRQVTFKGIESTLDSSQISGGIRRTFTGKPVDLQVKMYDNVVVTDSVKAPSAYLIPREWSLIAERLKLHGIKVDQLQTDLHQEVTKYKFKDVEFSRAPYEGRQRVSFNYDTFKEKSVIPAGTYKIDCNQPLIGLILHLLEPKGEDSFAKWGFFNTIFERKEYFENYVMEKLAAEMLQNDNNLKQEFDQRLKLDEAFRNNPNARLNFFYERSPYADKRLNLYPVVRIE